MGESKPPADYVPQWINKIEVAVRQLRVVVRLHFEECDPVALHTLVIAAHRIVADLANRTGDPSRIDQLRSITGFFQQAETDPDGRLNIEPLSTLTEDLLFEAVSTIMRLLPEENIPFEAKICFAWFVCTRPHLFQGSGPAIDAILRDNQHLATISFSEIRQLLRFNQVLDSSEPLPQWALLGPGLLTSRALKKQQAEEKQNKETLDSSQPADNGQEQTALPSQEYLEVVRAFESVVKECTSLSRQCSGIRSPTNSHFWASVLFTTLCTRAFSIAIVVPHSPWAAKVIEHWDYASVANLTRSLLEVRLAFFYLCTESCSEDAWRCRWNIFNAHDCASRIHMFTALDPSYDVSGFEEQLRELQMRLVNNEFFRSLPERKKTQFLNGKLAYLSPLEDIAVRAGVELREFRWLYKFLSSHVHGHPMSYYRMDEGGRGRGIHSRTEENYTRLCLSFSTALMTRARDEMRDKFQGLILPDGQQASDPAKGANVSGSGN